jgi:hypothetical protein
MASLTIVYWRDIPAQVIAKAGRKSAKIMLSDRFQEAIDRAAMRSGAAGTDDYLEDWRRGEPIAIEGDLQEVAENLAQETELALTEEALEGLIRNNGHKSI